MREPKAATWFDFLAANPTFVPLNSQTAWVSRLDHNSARRAEKLDSERGDRRAQFGLDYQNSPLMAEVPTGDYIHRSIDQLRSMNERGTLGAVIHDYKQFADLRNNIVTDYTIKNNLNNNNNLIDNRNTSASINNHSPALEQKHQIQHYSTPSTPPTPLSITDAQMNDAKVSEEWFDW